MKLRTPTRRPSIVLLAILAALAVLFVVLVPVPAQASEISSIDIVAQLQRDGSMEITDTRTFNVTEGSEHYLSLGHLADSEVSDFSVVQDGKPLTDVGAWDVNKSRQEKAGKSGIRKTAVGYELCFGFGTYGTHTAVLRYKVTNVVKKLTDGAQAVYWEFISKNGAPTDAVHVSVTNAVGFSYSQANTKIWGFGYEGSTTIEASRLTATTSAPIDADSHMVLLAIFPTAPFATSSTLDKSASELEAQAKEGSDFGADDDTGGSDDSGGSDYEDTGPFLGGAWVVIVFVMLGLGLPAILFAVGLGLYRAFRGPHGIKQLGFTKFARRVPRDAYWREIPYTGPIENLVALSGTAIPGLATALVLTWVKTGDIREVTQESGIVFKRDEPALALGPDPSFGQGAAETTTANPTRADFWDILVRAARDDRVLQRKEIKRFIARHPQWTADWCDLAEDYSGEALVQEGYLTERTGWWARTFSSKKYDATPEGEELARRILMFRNYLRDFSLLNERSAAQVALWDQYMIWAGYLGIADEVQKQLNLVDPAYFTQSNLTVSSLAASSFMSASISSAYSISPAGGGSGFGGGGGSSSMGGGGGSFGGGDGGGFR